MKNKATLKETIRSRQIGNGKVRVADIESAEG